MAFAALLTDARAAEGGISPPEERAKLKTGDYLLEDFHESLEETQSVFTAIRSQGERQNPEAVSVKHSRRQLRLSLSYSWHEGTLVTIREDGTVEAEEEDREEGTVLKVLDDSHFIFGAQDEPPQIYEFIGEDEHYITGLLLTGTYADDQGQIYIFGADNWAVFPDDTFKYSLCLDTAGAQSDQFWDEIHRKYYAFKRRGDALQIVDAPDDPDEPDWNHELLSLHRIGP